MKGFALPSNQDPRWRWMGWSLLAATSGLTLYWMLAGPKTLGPSSGAGDVFQPGVSGTYGTLTEMHGLSRMVLRYQTVAGQEEDLRLSGVQGELEEPALRWDLRSPKARRLAGAWTLEGPLDLQAKDAQGRPTGRGRQDQEGPALRFEEGRWTGLQPLRWDSLQGTGQGTWHLPAGWSREADGRMRVDRGPVTWDAATPGALRSLEAQSLQATPGFDEGKLGQTMARLSDGEVTSELAELTPEAILWTAPLHFRRTDGWIGKAEGGRAPRPAPGQGLSQVELRDFQARRAGTEGEELLSTEGVRWTTAGLRLEGRVLWEQPLDGQRLRLTGPRVLIRDGLGPDLPADLPVGQARAEGQPLLTWGRRSLGSPRMDLVRATRQWSLQAPVTGRAEEGSFSAGAGRGNPRAWTFEGPVSVSFVNGGNLRGASLLWEDARWTLLGRPAVWSRMRERLQGNRLVRQGDHLDFPEGLSGTLAAPEGDLSLRAGKGESDAAEVRLTGGVECSGDGWRLLADRVILRLGPGRVVQTILAEGKVSLRGRLGEGQGEALEMEPGSRKVKWQGRVRGVGSTGG